MKKNILVASLALLMTGSVFAQSPDIFDSEAHSAISADGNWIAGQIEDGSVIIRNVATNEFWTSFSNGGNTNYYIGIGQPISNTGVLAGATTTSNAAYWEGGKWTLLPVPYSGFICNATSITPDGNIICGGVGMAGMTDDTESTMLYPALWYRGEDGKFADPVILPHPDYDMTGRVPQYITALVISEDGKTVGGHVMDYTGLVAEPIVYHCDDSGNWNYTLLGRDFLNPTGIVFPEWPGGLDEDIVMPSQEWFMDRDQVEAFVEKMNDWDYTGDMPRYEDFMTPEQIEQYEEAVKEYLEIQIPWKQKYEAFMDVYRQYKSASSSFSYNNCRLSPDGKYYVNSAGLDKTHGSGVHPVVFDVASGEPTIIDTDRGINITSVTSDYSLLGYTGAGGETGTIKAYILPKMQPGGILLEDFVKEINPELYDWMEGILTHDVIIGLGQVTQFETEEMFCTGIPVATPDLKYIVTNNSTTSWDDYVGGPYITAYLPLDFGKNVPDNPEENGVNDIVISDLLRVDRNLLTVGEGVDSIEIFDLTGKRVMAVSHPSGTIDMGLSEGIYIVWGNTADGPVNVKVKI